MKKKIIFITLIIIVIIYILARLLEPHKGIYIKPKNAYNILKEYYIVEEFKPLDDKVTRLEFVTAVLKLIGANDVLAYDAFCTDFDSRYIGDMSEYYLNEEYTKSGYIFLATQSSDSFRLVYGKKRLNYNFLFDNISQLNISFVFDGYDFITIKEAAAISARCLHDSNVDAFKEYQTARKYGLINNTDLFATLLGDNSLKYKDMYILLYRLLNQRRYKYFICENSFMDSIGYDKKRSITYIQYLKEYKMRLNGTYLNNDAIL